MSLYLGNTPICGGIEGNQLNNPFSLLDYKYSEYELNNASWLLSNGQWNSGAVYQSVYNLLLQIYNGTVTKAGVSVKLSTETYADTDFVLNTSDTTFRLPIKVKLASGNAVVGNGMTLGLTNGNVESGLRYTLSTYPRFQGAKNSIGLDVGVMKDSSSSVFSDVQMIGVTTDETKSGIETSSSGLKLYFYVGETIQDANVINAAGVLTKVSNGIDRTVASDRETVVGWGMPDYSARITVANKVKTKAMVDSVYYGFCGLGGQGSDSLISVEVYDEEDNLIMKQGNRYQASGNSSEASVVIFLPKGYSIYIIEGRNVQYSLLCPLKGVN